MAWRALPALDAHPESLSDQEFTPNQQFFIAFAHSWAGAIRKEQAEELLTADPHPPAQFRTNATLANSPESQSAFAIAGPGPMVEAGRCVIW